MSSLALTCSDLTELVTDYLEHQLNVERMLNFEMHVVYCPGCRTFVSQMREMARRLAQLPVEGLRKPERDELLDTYRRATA